MNNLVPYRNEEPRLSFPQFEGASTWIILLLLVVLYIVLTRKGTSATPQIAATPSAAFSNKEEWEVSYNNEGLPTKIVVIRDAKQQ